jgi:iron complex outermembrane receptor protein
MIVEKSPTGTCNIIAFVVVLFATKVIALKSMSSRRSMIFKRAVWRTLAGLFLVLITIPSFGQMQTDCNLTVHGSIHEQHTHEPLIGVSIYVRETGKGTVTNEKGEYVLEHLCQGRYTLVCNHIGYHADTTYITVAPEVSPVNFSLQEEDVQLGTVIVNGQKADGPIASQTTTELSGLELQKTRGLSLGESLKGITGLNSLQTGPSISKPIIHGLHSNRILILNNGIRQEGQQWGSEHAPEIDPFVATKVSVIKGAAGVRYGSDAIGGVILVEPGDLPTTPGIDGQINLVGISNGREGVASGTLEGNIKQLNGLSWRVQGTSKRSGNVKTADYFLKNTGHEELNFSSALGYNKEKFGAEVFYSRFHTKLGIFSGSHIGNITDLNAVIASDRPLEEYRSGFSYTINRPYQNITHQLLKGNVYWKPSVGKISLVYAIQKNYRAEYDSHRPLNDSLAALNRPELQYTLWTYTSDLIWEHKPIHENFTGTIGVSSMWQSNVIGGRFLIPNFRNQGIGIFAIEKWSRDQWQAEAGIRYDYRVQQVFIRQRDRSISNPVYNFGNISGTLGGTYTVNKQISLKANIGTAWRPPAANELFSNGVHHGAAAFEQGDFSFTAEKSYQATFSAVYKSERWQAEIGVYHNRINNYIYLAPVVAMTDSGMVPQNILTIRGAFPYFKYKQTNASFNGVDASVSYLLMPEITWTSKLSLVRATNLETNEALPYIPSDRLENKLLYKAKKWGKINGAYAGVSSIHVARQWRVPQSNTDFKAAPAGYMLMNAEAGFTVPALQNLEVGITAQNLLNKSYRDYLNRFRYFTDDMGRSITLRLKVAF